jgi:signal transduction histidine kinase
MKKRLIPVKGIIEPINRLLEGIRKLKQENSKHRITDRTGTDKALQRAEQLLIAGNLVAGLTHELKNSLAGVGAAIEVLLSELAISDDHRSVLLRMSEEIRRMELLMKDVLNFARPARPQLSLVDINVILSNAIASSLENPSHQQEKNGAIKITKRCAADLPKTMADPLQLQQVFVHLLTNAVDSMPDGGSLTVETSYEPNRKLIQISLSDTGKGIRKEYMDKIFEPFFTTKSQRTGLGLAISRRLIEQNGGYISVDNNPNGGAIFKVSLPLRRPEEGNRYDM